MSAYFPEGLTIELAPGIQTTSFKLPDTLGTEILLSHLAPGATIPSHTHNAFQFGLAVSGSLLINVAGQERTLNPLTDAYIVPRGIEHSGANPGDEPVLTLDIKHDRVPAQASDATAPFLIATGNRTLKTGIRIHFFVTPWFEAMLSLIPTGGTMPSHKHRNIQLGVALRGQYQMTIGDEHRTFSAGQAYYAPPNTRHGAVNPFGADALAINLFYPPRYNKKRRTDS